MRDISLRTRISFPAPQFSPMESTRSVRVGIGRLVILLLLGLAAHAPVVAQVPEKERPLFVDSGGGWSPPELPGQLEGADEEEIGVLPEAEGDQPPYLPLASRKRGPSPAVDTTEYGSWDNSFGLPGVTGQVNAVVTDGSDVYIGGSFVAAGGKFVFNIARWDGNNWQALGTGISGEVYAIAVRGDLVYAAGSFQLAGGIAAENIAVWNKRTGEWKALAEGVGGDRFAYVSSLAFVGNDLYVGGRFLVAGHIVAVNIARWNGSGWGRVGTGVNGYVFALKSVGDQLYVGGRFTLGGKTRLERVARWDATQSSWNALGGGVRHKDSGYVSAFAVLGNKLYVGGRFTTADGDTVNNVVGWDMEKGGWSALDNGIAAIARPYGYVYALAVHQNYLYAAGQFDSIANVTGRMGEPGNPATPVFWLATEFARWDGKEWTAFRRPSYASSGVVTISGIRRNSQNGLIAALAIDGAGKVYLGGRFHIAGPSYNDSYGNVVWSPTEAVFANNICAFDGDTIWSVLGNGLNSQDRNGRGGYVRDIELRGDELYVCGNFENAGPRKTDDIAMWNRRTKTWSAPGGPLRTASHTAGSNTQINAVEFVGDDLYVGGTFDLLNGREIAGIARLDGTTGSWNDLKTPGFQCPPVTAMKADGTNLYVASTQGLHLWNGTSWSDFAGTINGQVRTLAVADGRLYVGGKFSEAGGVPAENFAIWSLTERRWLSDAPKVSDTVHAILVENGKVYIGGRFRKFDGIDVGNVVLWDAGTLTTDPLLGGTEGVVNALALGSGGLYIGGSFPRIDNYAMNNVSRYDGERWNDVDRGVTDRDGIGTVYRLLLAPGESPDELFAGGSFEYAGGRASYRIARWSRAISDAPLVEQAAFDRNAGEIRLVASIAPNPLSNTTTFVLKVPRSGPAALALHDMRGEIVKRVFSGTLEAGDHALSISLEDLPAGHYIYRAAAAGAFEAGRIVIER